MQIFYWQVGRSSFVLPLMGVALTIFITHLCCILPLILVPLGFGGISLVLERVSGSLKLWLMTIPLGVLLITGSKAYTNTASCFIDKITFWISLLLVTLMFFYF